jgi:UDP-GlcNAc:undecaprenyl-phosphate GlcNAc-1-phosphate transferase
MILKYLTPFLTAFLLTVFFTAILIWLAKKIKWQGRKSLRHIHSQGVPRIGGIAMILAFNGAIFLNKDLFISPELYGFILGTLILLVAGFWDDVKEIYWKIQLFIQVALAVLVFILGIRIYYVTNPLTGGIIHLDSGLGVIISITLVIFWILTVMNAINWSDGIDGMAGGISFISAMTIFSLSLHPDVNQPAMAIVSIVLAGTILAFLIFNFYPARILAGTSGAIFMGFSLAVLAIFAGTKIATALLVLSMPIIDFLWVIGERIKNHKSIFQPDRNHLHYKLMEIGWSQKKIVFVYWTVTLLVAIVALNTKAIGKGITLFIAVIVMVSALMIINKKIDNK